MKKKMMLVLAAITAVSAAYAVPAMAEGVTLNVTTTYAGEDGNAQNYKDSVAAWEAESGNKVEDSSATSRMSCSSSTVWTPTSS